VILPQVDGYVEKWQELEVNINVLELTLVRATPPITLLTGSISPPPSKGQVVIMTWSSRL
jgi:hypothetical protein